MALVFMDWVWQVILFGSLAFFLFIGSVASIKKEWHVLGLGFGILELLSATVSSSAWAWALKVSGKGDWFLFGLFGYPLIAPIFFSMFVVGALCVRASIRGLVKQGKSTDTEQA